MTDAFSRRPEWVRWIPAAMLSAVIIGALGFALIEGPRLAAGPGPAQPGQVTELNWSVFTEEGLAFIESARTPRIDFSTPPIAADEIGLPADASVTVGPHATGLDYRLVLIATDDRPNGALFTTPQFTLTTVGGELESIRIETRVVNSFSETYIAVSERSSDFGYTAPSTRQLAQAVSDARESGQPAIVRTDRGTAAGVGVVAEVICFGVGVCQLSYVVTPAVG